MRELTCPQCKGGFIPTHGGQKYCGIECRTRFLNARHRRATGPVKRRGARKRYEKRASCLQCDVALPPRRRRFCSEDCAETYWNESRSKGIVYHSLSEVDEAAGTAVCAVCGPVEARPLGNRVRPDGRPIRICRNKQLEGNRADARREADWRKRGIDLTVERYDEMMGEQEGACAICRRAFGESLQPHVDHCHSGGHVRGLLCSPCNLSLGKFDDDPERLEAAAAYLREKQVVSTAASSS